MKRREGFTLVELLVVIAIIGLLAGLLLPAVSRVRSRAVAQKCQAQLKDMGTAFHLFQTVYGGFPSAANGGRAKIAVLVTCKRTGFDPQECTCPASGNSALRPGDFHPNMLNDTLPGTTPQTGLAWESLDYGGIAVGTAMPVDTMSPATFAFAAERTQATPTTRNWHAGSQHVLCADGHVEALTFGNTHVTWNDDFTDTGFVLNVLDEGVAVATRFR